MAQADSGKFQEDYALFIESGFIAVKQLDELSATRLFRAAELLQPDNPASQVGLGYIALNKLEVKRAIEIFSKVVKEHPDHDLAMTFLGIAYALKKSTREKGEAMIKEVMRRTEDPTVKNLAEVSLKWIDSDFQEIEVSVLLEGRKQRQRVLIMAYTNYKPT